MLWPSSILLTQRLSFSSTGAQSTMGMLSMTAMSCSSPLARKVPRAEVKRNMPILSRISEQRGILRRTSSTTFFLPLFQSQRPPKRQTARMIIRIRANQQKP